MRIGILLARVAVFVVKLRLHQPETTVAPSFPDDIGRSSIDITEPQQIVFWTQELGVSEMELRYAVAAAGESLGDIRDYLGVK